MDRNSSVLNDLRSVPGNGCDSDDGVDGQILRVAVAPGGRVRVRGRTWRVVAITPHRTCAAVRLNPEMSCAADVRTVIVPFDRIRPHEVVASGWRRAALRLAAGAVGTQQIEGSWLRGAPALHASLALLPWQLTVPSLVMAGGVMRVLLADAVGLGKTVQAGLTMAAMHANAHASRTLVLAPAALCEQWARELRRLFGWPIDMLDAAAVRRLRRELPSDVNAWAVPRTVVASIDFVKQPEVLGGVLAAPWDLLIADEAHHLAPGTDRFQCAHAIATRTPVILLLTATPHAGCDGAFEALRRVGAIRSDPPALVVRRTRADVGLAGTRRLRVIASRSSPAERRLWAALRSYAAAVWRANAGGGAARLAMTVLLKRAASSTTALRRSLAHRRRAVGGEPQALQVPLPFAFDAGEHDVADEAMDPALGVPGLDDTGREVDWLRRLENLADAASGAESKLTMLRRLLRRIHEPVVVFTEYRDTLRGIEGAVPSNRSIALLHGGLSRDERREAERAFAQGRAQVLLATDVGSEGLNLQHRARVVVSVELPWSPTRLEQRVGRVDRIGQTRMVHGLTLVGSTGPERDVLRHLAARIAHIERALGDTIVMPHCEETRLAAAALGFAAPSEEARTPPVPSVAFDTTRVYDVPALSAARALAGIPGGPGQDSPSRRRRRVPWARLRSGNISTGVVLVFQVRTTTETGTVVGAVLVPVHVALHAEALRRARPVTLIRALAGRAADAALAAAHESLAAASAAHRVRVDAWRDRVANLLAALRATRTNGAMQPGLFDRRALAAAARRNAATAEREADLAARLQRLQAEGSVRPPDPPQPIAAFLVR